MIKYFLSILMIPYFVNAQSIDLSKSTILKLSDGNKVGLVVANACEHCYYYLPTNFRVSINKAKKAEASFITWKNEEGSETVGGILHLLFVWGLNPIQNEELQKKIKIEIDSSGVLLGPVALEHSKSKEEIWFSGEEEIVELLNACLTQSVKTTTLPGAKMALAFRFNKKQIKFFLKRLEDKELNTEINFELQLTEPYDYTLIQKKLSLKTVMNLIGV